MHFWKISPDVGNARNNHPRLLDRIDDNPEDDELGLFE
jgi:hypothetical protein